MKKSIDNIVRVKKGLKVNINQSVYLLSIQIGLTTVDICNEDLIDLINRDLVHGNKLTQTSLEVINTASKVKLSNTLPQLSVESGQIVKKLAKHFISDDLTDRAFSKTEAYFPNNIYQVPFFFMFMQMFPSIDPTQNVAWEKKFKHRWCTPTLRRYSIGSVRKFQTIWKTKDIGIFLLGTYMFIQESYDPERDKFFIKKIENYLKEYQHWYDMAEEMVSSGKLDHLTQQQHKSNTFII